MFNVCVCCLCVYLSGLGVELSGCSACSSCPFKRIIDRSVLVCVVCAPTCATYCILLVSLVWLSLYPCEMSFGDVSAITCHQVALHLIAGVWRKEADSWYAHHVLESKAWIHCSSMYTYFVNRDSTTCSHDSPTTLRCRCEVYEEDPDMVWLLQKPLYGMRSAARA